MQDAECPQAGHCSSYAKVCVEAVSCPAGSPEGTACDDRDACTEGDHCDAAGICVGTPKSCASSNHCVVEGCDPNMGCTQKPRDCNDGNACTTDSCDPAQGCSHALIQKWCARNCESVLLACSETCNTSAGPAVATYCADQDRDGYPGAACGTYCTAYTSAPAGAPPPLFGPPLDGYLTQADHQTDCNDAAPAIHPNAPELCSAVDENCDGDPYGGLPRPGSTQPCTRCDFSGTQTVDAACAPGACNIGPATDFGPLPPPTDPAWSHSVPNCILCFGHPCDSGDHWCGEGSSDFVVYGPYRALPAGNYVVHFRGTHNTSSTWMDVRDATTGQDVPGTAHNVTNGTAIPGRFDWDIPFAAEECHQYEFRIRSTYSWSIHYGIKVEHISLSKLYP